MLEDELMFASVDAVVAATVAATVERLGFGLECETEFKLHVGPELACELEFGFEHGLGIQPALSASVSGIKAELGSLLLAAMVWAAARPMTTHSSKELLAKRFAPCKPVQATSPTAYKPGTVVRPDKSV